MGKSGGGYQIQWLVPPVVGRLLPSHTGFEREVVPRVSITLLGVDGWVHSENRQSSLAQTVLSGPVALVSAFLARPRHLRGLCCTLKLAGGVSSHASLGSLLGFLVEMR